MKIGLATTMPPSNENKRIREEVNIMGHIYTQYNLGNLSLKFKSGRLYGDLVDIDDDVLIVRGILSSLRSISAIAKYLRRKGVKVFDNNFLEHEYSISKITDMIKLTLNGVLIPNTYHLRDFKDYIYAAKDLGYPLVVKSNRTGKGKGVYKSDNSNQLKKLIDNFIENGSSAKNYIIQEFIPYKYDIRALIIGNNVYSMRRIPKNNEFRANFSLGGSVEKIELSDNVKKLAIKALSAIDMSVGGVDILITSDGKKYILEVNHNAGFTGMEEATGKNIAKIFVEHAIKEAK